MKQRLFQSAICLFALPQLLLAQFVLNPAQAASGITEKDLLNINCSIPSLGDGPDDQVTFHNGKSKWGENTGEILCTASGDLNHDGIADGAIVYGYNSGGSGFFTSLLIFLSVKGKPVHWAR